MTETVRIRSRLHPAGRLYELVPADSRLGDDERRAILNRWTEAS